MYTLADFEYDLPKELIAQEPVHPADGARLMLINRQTQEISHHQIFDLPHLLSPEYFFVANNTKVFPARLLGHKATGGKVEILLTSPLGHSSYRCITRPGLKLKENIFFSNQLSGVITHVKDIERTIHFNQEESLLRTTLSELGTMPTPPYIKKMLANQSDYQTIYAKYGFSAAAPTAGLHFTPQLLTTLKQSHAWHELTLNVGLGTFLPVKVQDITRHPMHSESYIISPTTAHHLPSLKQARQQLLAIGTTTLRALESNVALCHRVTAGAYTTDIFIYPPYQFKLVDALLTNFHLPGSTLLMLVSAFCSAPQTPHSFTTFSSSLLGYAYAEAIREKYRFFSFGDAMLII
ncbi:MAG: tRNA preQ1(34) S-adenosylmethionine ribosyltransferase-isomerase QueA [bacterium]